MQNENSMAKLHTMDMLQKDTSPRLDYYTEIAKAKSARVSEREDININLNEVKMWWWGD